MVKADQTLLVVNVPRFAVNEGSRSLCLEAPSVGEQQQHQVPGQSSTLLHRGRSTWEVRWLLFGLGKYITNRRNWQDSPIVTQLETGWVKMGIDLEVES